MSIAENLQSIRARIRRAAEAAGRDPDGIELVAVTKTHPAPLVRRAWEAGVAVVGENYIQEAREKITALADCALRWHFIGHLQSNKARQAVEGFELIHSVDSFKLGREIDKQAARIGKVQPILVQVNISREATKSGSDPGGGPGTGRSPGAIDPHPGSGA